MRAIRLGLFVSILTTFLAGLYFVVYIYRWEMHRALIAGVVFLAGEIALATTLVLRRVEALHDVAPPVPPPQPPAVRVSDTPKQQEQPYPWLGADRFSVFVPLLLGAGTIVSGVGWVVEHLARVSGGSARAGGRFERNLAAIAMPPSPLVGPAPTPDRVATADDRTPPRLGMLGRITVFLLIVGLASVLLTLALLGRSRSDTPIEGTRSVIEMEVSTRNDLDVDVAANSLWGACHVWAPEHELLDLSSPQPGQYVLTIAPALGDQVERRLLGCLNDGTLERVHADLGDHFRVGG